jgi:hypothetical protein
MPRPIDQLHDCYRDRRTFVSAYERAAAATDGAPWSVGSVPGKIVSHKEKMVFMSRQ